MIIYVFSCVYEAASIILLDISLDRCIQYSLVWSAGYPWTFLILHVTLVVIIFYRKVLCPIFSSLVRHVLPSFEIEISVAYSGSLSNSFSRLTLKWLLALKFNILHQGIQHAPKEPGDIDVEASLVTR